MAGLIINSCARSGDAYLIAGVDTHGTRMSVSLKNSTGSKITKLTWWLTCEESGVNCLVTEAVTDDVSLAKGGGMNMTRPLAAAAASVSNSIGEYLQSHSMRKSTSGTVTLHLSANGYTATADMDLSVLDTQCGPEVDTFSVQRCNSEGVATDAGTHMLVTAQLSMADTSWLERFTLILEYGNAAEDLSAHISDMLSGSVTLMSSIADITPGDDHAFRLVFGEADGGESAYQNASLERVFINFDESDTDTGGVAVGKYSSATEGNPMFECDYPAYLYKGLSSPGLTDFSNGEVKTGGTWLDGRAIYARTFHDTLTDTGTNVGIGTISGFSELIGVCGHMIRSSGGANIPVNCFLSTSSYASAYVTSGGQVTAKTSHAGEFWVTVW